MATTTTGAIQIGDRVAYVSGIYGDTERANPLWGGRQGNVCGVVANIDDTFGGYTVQWSNGTHNGYRLEDLRLLSKKGELPDDLPKELTFYVRVAGINLNGYSYLGINAALKLYEEYLAKARGGRRKSKTIPFVDWLRTHTPKSTTTKYRTW